MMLLFWKPYYMGMIFILFFGVFLSISCNNWVAIWLGLEVNLYSFIPILLISLKNQEKEAAVKYFIAQAVPSALMVMFFLTPSSFWFSSALLLSSMMMKMGVAPFHFWLPSVMGAVSWGSCFLLATIQKISPTLVLFYLGSFSMTILVYIGVISSLVGGLGGLNQTMLRVLLAYSSIGHMGWILGSMVVDKAISLFYLTSYILIVSCLIFMLDKISAVSGNYMFSQSNSLFMVFLLVFLFMSLGGLPPFLGFFPKMMVLWGVSADDLILLGLGLILGSVINLYYYMKIIFVSLLSKNKTAVDFSFVSLDSFNLMFSMVLMLSFFGGMIFIVSVLM